MRELNECKAEIFRRSEKRIKERKRKRNRLIAFCVPLCICLAVISTSINFGMMGAKSGDSETFAGREEKSTDISNFIKVEISNRDQSAENYKIITDSDKINSILILLDSDADENGSAVNPEDNSSGDFDYLITFTDRNGYEAVYKIKGNILFDVNSNNQKHISDEQLTELITILGLTN